ncbi:hypothetical protein DPEC_G00361870 [Dallia pectoralis]|nr:hypothetical protein DPEC_G00361870 [Dallia pectoralis]
MSFDEVESCAGRWTRIPPTQCLFHFEGMLERLPLQAESLYSLMSEISLYNSSKQLFDMVVKPFVLGKHVEPEISIQVLDQPVVGSGTGHACHAYRPVTVPLGMYYRYTLRELNWYTGSLGANKWVVRAKNKRVVSSEGVWNLRRASTGERKSLGFFVTHFRHISGRGRLPLRSPGLCAHNRGRVTRRVRKDVVVVLRKGLDVNCMWKPGYTLLAIALMRCCTTTTPMVCARRPASRPRSRICLKELTAVTTGHWKLHTRTRTLDRGPRSGSVRHGPL